MENATLVKTYTPIIPAGQGPTCIAPEDAIRELIADVYSRSDPQFGDYSEAEMEAIVDAFKGPVSRFPDGLYTMTLAFENALSSEDFKTEYQISVIHMKQEEIDAMPEFMGY